MNKENITLSKTEVMQLKILHRNIEGDITQVKASEISRISDRQVRNVLKVNSNI